MDTTKVTFKQDSTVISNNTVVNTHVRSSQIIRISDRKMFTDLLCNCEIISNLIWPITVLIIVLLFRSRIKNLLDGITDRIKKGHNIKVGPSGIEIGRELNNEEIVKKGQTEFQAFIKAEQRSNVNDKKIPAEDYIPKYFSIERRLFETFIKNLYPDYRVLSNRSVQGYEFDVIIEGPNNKDYIIEIKYYRIGFIGELWMKLLPSFK